MSDLALKPLNLVDDNINDLLILHAVGEIAQQIYYGVRSF